MAAVGGVAGRWGLQLLAPLLAQGAKGGVALADGAAVAARQTVQAGLKALAQGCVFKLAAGEFDGGIAGSSSAGSSSGRLSAAVAWGRNQFWRRHSCCCVRARLMHCQQSVRLMCRVRQISSASHASSSFMLKTRPIWGQLVHAGVQHAQELLALQAGFRGVPGRGGRAVLPVALGVEQQGVQLVRLCIGRDVARGCGLAVLAAQAVGDFVFEDAEQVGTHIGLAQGGCRGGQQGHQGVLHGVFVQVQAGKAQHGLAPDAGQGSGVGRGGVRR